MQEQVSTYAFKCLHIKSDNMLSKRKKTEVIGMNETLTISKYKIKASFVHRFAHIFKSIHNLVHAISQVSFRFVMDLRVTTWSI